MKRIYDRNISSFGISIGTALALESLFKPSMARYDEDREIPNELEVNDYKYHYFNIFLLLRNIVSATELKADEKTKLFSQSSSYKVVYEILMEELEVLNTLYSNNGNCIPVLFIPDYSKLRLTTNKIRNLSALHNVLDTMYKVVIKMVKDDKKSVNISIYDKGYSLPSDGEKALITTNFTVDLLSKHYSTKLELLESNTGKLKTNKDWWSKYHAVGKQPMNMLPFTPKLLMIFGDNTLIRPEKVKTRQDIIALAIDKKWTPYTNNIKIENDLKQETELYNVYNNVQIKY
jgi:hypothetical protein